MMNASAYMSGYTFVAFLHATKDTSTRVYHTVKIVSAYSSSYRCQSSLLLCECSADFSKPSKL